MTTFCYGYAGKPEGTGTQLSWDQMMTKSTVSKSNPEVLRRLKAMLELAASQGVPLGVGTGWRIQPANKPGFAKPGNSYHESFEDGGSLAFDMVPAPSWDWLEQHAGNFGFRTFRYVNNEPWHIQPVEVSTSRKFARRTPALKHWSLGAAAEILERGLGGGGTGAPVSVPPAAGAPTVPAPVLKEGVTSLQVRMLIDIEKFWKWYPAEHLGDENNGKFGQRTKLGTMAMQRAIGAKDDGEYGPKSAEALATFLGNLTAMATT